MGLFCLKLFFGLPLQMDGFSLWHFYVSLVFHLLISFFSVSNVASVLFVTVLFLFFFFSFVFRNLEKDSFRGIMENVTTIPFLLFRCLL